MMMMSDDDDDFEPQLKAVSDYFFVDREKNAVCFSVLPIRFKEDKDEPPECKSSVFLRGTADPGIAVYKQVVAWKLGLDARQPEIAVLSKEGSWINLAKPRNSYEVNFRTIFITVQMLHFLRRKPEEPEKSLWNHLRKVFDKFDVRPSKDDFRNHRSLMKQFAEKDSNLAKSQMFRAFIEERSKKQISEVDSDNFEMKESFIAADEDVEDMVADGSTESDEDEEDDLFDFTCAICDNGGDLLGCDGPCMRSFHAKKGTGEDSYCDTLGFTEAKVEAMKTFLCENCEYKQHQCFICGVLEPSDGPTAKVFLCNNATCGYFYHPKCVARRLHPNSKFEAIEKENSITAGSSFTCPIHWCFQCKGLEDRSQEHLQFAVCRRCPKSYHRKCLPREIPFEDSDDEDIVTRAWDLSKRILIYCLDHEIDSDVETPVRNHIKFPGIAKIGREADFLKKKTNMLTKKKKRAFDETLPDQPSNKPAKLPIKVRVQKDEHTRSAVKSSYEQLAEKPEKKKVKLLEQRTQPEPESTKPNLARVFSASSPRLAKEQEKYLAASPSSTTGNMPRSLFPKVDSETEKRVIALVEKEVSSLTLKDIASKCFMPSTHVYSGKQTDKIVATGRLDGSVQAVGAALKILDSGGNVNDAKVLCEPQVLTQLSRWHTRLRVYLSPFIHGPRYSSLGRHFTKVEKLIEIVDRLHWYVEPGDTIVDFCCGANDFSRLMKEKLDHVEKSCHFQNYDLIQPQSSFCFEKRDWMTVQPNELPRGSQLIMGLNPPFGVKAALANKFIDKALSFKPKLIVLIVPKETKRLDQKRTPYDLVWEDGFCLAGKSFYYPGSLGVDEQAIEGWNKSAPPLYLWSRPDWTNKHKKIAEEHNHTNMGIVACRIEEGNLSNDILVKKETKSSDVRNSRSGKKKENRGKTSCHPREVNLSDIPIRRQAKPEKSEHNGGSGKAKETRGKTAHDVGEVSPTGKAKDSRERTSCYVREVTQSDEPLVKKQNRSEEEKAKADCLVKNQGRSGEEKAKEANCLVREQARSGDEKKAIVSDNHPVKKQAEATSQQICRPVKQNSRDGSRSSDYNIRKRTPDEVDSLPPEKQVEVAYEETRVIPSKRSIHQDQRDALCDPARVQESKSGGSDMSISSPQASNAQYGSRSNSPFLPTEQPSDYRTAHLDGNTSYHVKEPHIPTCQGSYLSRSDGHNDAPEGKKHPMYYTSTDDISRKYSSSIEDLTKWYAAAPASDVYSLQAQGDGSNLYRRQDDYLQTSRYSLGPSGAGYDQPSLTSQSYGLSGTTASRSSVMEKYGSGLLGATGSGASVMDTYGSGLGFGASGSGASVMDRYAPTLLAPSAPGNSVTDRYAPPLADTNYATRGVPDGPGYGRGMSGDPLQYPYRGPGSSGRGPPYH